MEPDVGAFGGAEMETGGDPFDGQRGLGAQTRGDLQFGGIALKAEPEVGVKGSVPRFYTT